MIVGGCRRSSAVAGMPSIITYRALRVRAAIDVKIISTMVDRTRIFFMIFSDYCLNVLTKIAK